MAAWTTRTARAFFLRRSFSAATIPVRHRLSSVLMPTRKEIPRDAPTLSHQLMLRAGMIHPLGSGLFALLPLGLRVLQRVEKIIDLHLQDIGCQRCVMPALLPAQLWKQSTRWENAGPELFRLQDRKGADYCLGSTHEEAFTSTVASLVKSSKDLPLRLYQIGSKFRDELRPRGGFLRGREFVMKDLYSFDVDEQSSLETYHAVSDAYCKIYRDLQLPFVRVAADSGKIGGNYSHEFHCPAEVGEDVYAICRSCGYAANVEKALGYIPSGGKPAFIEVDKELELEKLLRPSLVNVWDMLGASDDLRELCSVSILSVTYGSPVANAEDRSLKGVSKVHVFVVGVGGRTINELSLKAGLENLGLAPDWHELQLISCESDPQAALGALLEANAGDSRLPTLVDENVFQVSGAAVPAKPMAASNGQLVSKGMFHIVEHGDSCAACNKGTLETQTGVEIGHIFHLGTQYSSLFSASFKSPNRDKREDIDMGCYGIGVSRLLAVLVEQHSDERGIMWPCSVAPYAVCIVVLGLDSRKPSSEPSSASAEVDSMHTASEVYSCLQTYPEFQDNVLVDDRVGLTPGYKFADAELVGFPFVVVIGRAMKEEGKVEIKCRRTKSVSLCEPKDVSLVLSNLMSEDKHYRYELQLP